VVMIHSGRAEIQGPANMRTGVPGRRRPRMLLASQSPRRRELMRLHGLEHDAVHPGVDDGLLSPGGVAPESWVAALAYYKAAAAASILPAEEEWLVIGADTVCLKDGELIGQPRDAADAERIIRTLESGSHEVLTGVALLLVGPHTGSSGRVRDLFVDRATVRVGTIGDGAIRDYIAGGQWSGKAGAYNLIERQEAGWPIEYQGDPTTVMGLPMRALLARLAR